MDPNVDLLGNSEMPVREPGWGFLSMAGYALCYAILAAAGAYAFLLARDKIRDMNEESQKKYVSCQAPSTELRHSLRVLC